MEKNPKEALKIRAVIFDLFETLVDFSLEEYNQVLTAMAVRLGIAPDVFISSWHSHWPRHEMGEFASTMEYIEAIAGPMPIGSDLTGAIALHEEYQKQVLIPNPETIHVMKRLKQAGYRIGVVTNCPIETPVLWPGSPLSEWVDAAVFSTIERVRKPNPAIFLSCLKRLGCVPSECIYIGDGANQELLAASSLGMFSVQLKNGEKGKDAGIYQYPQMAHLSELIYWAGIKTIP
ncbi:MAG: HAD-IA family hydrolase [Thermodesulfobacteriota bacterium]